MATITFHSADRRLQLSNRTLLKSFIENIFSKEKKRLVSLNYIFCSDQYLLQINRNFLQHDFYTDIISFNLSDAGQPVEAEVYISVDRVKENAIAHSETYRQELLRVIFHGALHLCGYKDKRKSEIVKMRRKEEQYLRLFEKKLNA